MSTIRNYHFDNIKALLIFLVVFGHLIEPLTNIPLFENLYFIIYSFHMPLFIFISGYFARANTKGIKKLFKLLIKYEIIYGLVYFLLFSGTGSNQFGSFLDIVLYVLQPIWVLWFLLSLICWRYMIIAYERHRIVIIFLIMVVIGFNFIPFNFRVLSLGRTLSFFPYFLLGYLAKKHQFDFHRIMRNHTFTYYLAIIVVLFWALYSGNVITELLYGATSFNNYSYSFAELFLFKVNLYLVAIAVSIIIFNIIPTTKTRFSSIGPKTLPIFLWHPVIIWLLIRINFFAHLQDFSSLSILIITSLLSSFIVLFLKDRKI